MPTKPFQASCEQAARLTVALDQLQQQARSQGSDHALSWNHPGLGLWQMQEQSWQALSAERLNRLIPDVSSAELDITPSAERWVLPASGDAATGRWRLAFKDGAEAVIEASISGPLKLKYCGAKR